MHGEADCSICWPCRSQANLEEELPAAGKRNVLDILQPFLAPPTGLPSLASSPQQPHLPTDNVTGSQNDDTQLHGQPSGPLGGHAAAAAAAEGRETAAVQGFLDVLPNDCSLVILAVQLIHQLACRRDVEPSSTASDLMLEVLELLPGTLSLCLEKLPSLGLAVNFNLHAGNETAMLHFQNTMVSFPT